MSLTRQTAQWGRRRRRRSFHFMLLYFAAPANSSDRSAAVGDAANVEMGCLGSTKERKGARQIFSNKEE